MTGAKIGFFQNLLKLLIFKNKKPELSFDYDELSYSTHKKSLLLLSLWMKAC